MRHLFLAYPADANVLDIEDQYLLGDDLLVAPILDEADKRDVYLPAGIWRPLFGKSEIKGGQWLRNIEVPFAQIPVYARADASSKVLRKALVAIAGILAKI